MSADQSTNLIASDTALGSERFYYGWIILPIAMIAFVCTSPTQTFGVSVFNKAIRSSLGLSNSELTGAYMLGTLLASLPMHYIGSLMDRFGLRRTMTCAVVAVGFACIAVSQATGVFTLFLAFLIMRMSGQGALGMLAGNALPFWFERKLGTVEGVRNFGMAGAMAVIPGLALWLISQVGWRWAYACLGFGVWVIMLPLMLLFRNRPEDVGQRIEAEGKPRGVKHHQTTAGLQVSFTVRQAARTRAFWIVACSSATFGMTMTAVLFNIVPLMHERGLAESDVARMYAVFAISLALTQLIGGMLADRIPLNRLLCAAMTMMAAAMFCVWQLSSQGMVYAVGVLLGGTQGLLVASTGPLWPRYFGRASLGRIRGTLATVGVASTSVGPFILGFSHDFLGSFTPALTVFALLPWPLVGLSLLATPPRVDQHKASERALVAESS